MDHEVLRSTGPVGALAEQILLLEEYGPIGYTEKLRNRALAALLRNS